MTINNQKESKKMIYLLIGITLAYLALLAWMGMPPKDQ